jgi:hypothetical protein
MGFRRFIIHAVSMSLEKGAGKASVVVKTSRSARSVGFSGGRGRDALR